MAEGQAKKVRKEAAAVKSRDTAQSSASNEATSSRIVTRSKTMQTRRSLYQATFLTTELLESILGFLPMKYLLLAQRVCQNWKELIEHSPVLQQALFKNPIVPEFRWRCELEGKRTVGKITMVPKETPLGKDDGSHVFNVSTLNPLVFFTQPKLDEPLPGRANPAFVRFGFHQPLEALYKGAYAGMPKLPSWRNMLVAQPPVYKVNFMFSIHTKKDGKIGGSIETVQNPNGVTIDDLFDAADRKTDEYKRGVWIDMLLVGFDMLVVTEEESKLMEKHNGQSWPKASEEGKSETEGEDDEMSVDGGNDGGGSNGPWCASCGTHH